MKTIFTKYFEISFWIASMVCLAIMSPTNEGHYSFCIFKMLGFTFCPGCGLGHSISYLLHGNLKSSFRAHPLGMFAAVVIILRINTLGKFTSLLNNININHGAKQQRQRC